jgi:hypothetical protein
MATRSFGSRKKILHAALRFVFVASISFRCHAQTASPTSTNAAVPQIATSATRVQSDASHGAVSTNLDVRAEQIRTACIQGRRTICGKILQIFPEGLVVESGYSSLLRPELNRSWLVPGTVIASRDPHLVEGQVPGEIATGLVFLTDLPRSRGPKPKPKQYDYVVIQAYPAGQFTYTSVGTIQRTVRRFACGLETAVRLDLSAEGGEKGK